MMFDDFELPLALIFEEILNKKEKDAPEDEKQKPEKTEWEKGKFR